MEWAIQATNKMPMIIASAARGFDTDSRKSTLRMTSSSIL